MKTCANNLVNRARQSPALASREQMEDVAAFRNARMSYGKRADFSLLMFLPTTLCKRALLEVL